MEQSLSNWTKDLLNITTKFAIVRDLPRQPTEMDKRIEAINIEKYLIQLQDKGYSHHNLLTTNTATYLSKQTNIYYFSMDGIPLLDFICEYLPINICPNHNLLPQNSMKESRRVAVLYDLSNSMLAPIFVENTRMGSSSILTTGPIGKCGVKLMENLLKEYKPR